MTTDFSDAKGTVGERETPVKILFVDDEPYILSTLKRTLHDFEGWNLYFSSSPLEALEIIAKNQITVLVSDHQMPQMTGANFLARVKDKRPNMVRILLTGQADLDDVKKAVNEGEIFRFILKPWQDAELKHALKTAVDYARMTEENERLSRLTQAQNTQLKELNQSLEEKVKVRTEQLSDALHTAQKLNMTLEESLYTVGKVFFSLVELAQPEIGSHSRRVAEHAVEIGSQFNLNQHELLELEIAAMLHDIGKMGLPLFMLEKNYKDYNQEEFEIYKMHPIAGGDYLKQVRQYEQISKYIQQHHELYNGQGFPQGLKGSAVPLPAMIIGIINEYDQMINRPNYDRHFNFQYTFQKLSEMRDKEYPAKLVDSVLSYIEKINEESLESNETKTTLNDLVPSMMLARDIFTMSGSLLLAKGAILTPSGIKRIHSIAKIDPIAGGGIYLRGKQASGVAV